jgi:hypothetical protein
MALVNGRSKLAKILAEETEGGEVPWRTPTQASVWNNRSHFVSWRDFLGEKIWNQVQLLIKSN